VGRLFDAAAALLGFSGRVSYEGQAAIQLEAQARKIDPGRAPVYPCGSSNGVLDPAPLLAALLRDLDQGVEPAVIAGGFHAGLAVATADLAAALASAHQVATVVLTGGVFANVLLSDEVAARLQSAGLEVLQHRELPPGDGSISLGQAAVAAARLAAGKNLPHPAADGN
jgi:hydrogenase maturation protein HypF